MRPVWRAPLVALALLSMIWGVWLGLLRLGWALPLPKPDQLILHGPLMIGGFIGTLIGLERAVGLGTWWAYSAPALTAAGSLALVLGPSPSSGALFITLGSIAVTAVYGVVLRRHPSMAIFTMAAGAAAWVVGNLQWLAGFAIYRVVFWWIAFLILTIAGERLELTRFLNPSRRVRLAFIVVLAVVLAGTALGVRWTEFGVRILGVGLAALSVWLIAHDMARRAIRQPGLTRFVAICLLSGYVWLGAGGLLAIVTGAGTPGPSYDAVLHALLIGFVMSMILGHAPIVFPAVLGKPLPFRWSFYVPLVVLHLSVSLRIAGDLVDELGRLRPWGGLLNAAALALFAANTAGVFAWGAIQTSSRAQ